MQITAPKRLRKASTPAPAQICPSQDVQGIPSLGESRAPNVHHPVRTASSRFVIAQTTPKRVDSLKSFTAKIGRQTDIVVAELLRASPGHGITDAAERAESYAVCAHLSGLCDYDVWCNDRHLTSRAIPAGAIHINDMRHSWRADIRSPFHVVNLYIPQAALDEFTDEQGISRVEELRCDMDSGHIDSVFSNLAFALLPTLTKPDITNGSFAEYALRAATAHLVRNYARMRPASQHGRGGLAPWQERRTKEMLIADLSHNITSVELASACGLSSSHFIHAFKQSVGVPPRQWLLAQRVERAKQLLLNTDHSLCQIALETGFADQSHFTRIFSRRMKESPAAWRRAQKR